MWTWTVGDTCFHSLTKYRASQMELRGMTSEEFDSLKVFLMKQDERTPHATGMTLGQFRGDHRDEDALELLDPSTGHKHAVLDVDKQFETGRIIFTVAAEPSE